MEDEVMKWREQKAQQDLAGRWEVVYSRLLITFTSTYLVYVIGILMIWQLTIRG